MCGICGLFDLRGEFIDPAVLERMNAVIRHRGPDGDGQLIDHEVGLGHRRLSIIDVGGGAQPIGNEDGRIQVVFNGEIYNFVELRNELEGAGHHFRTRSDTEVIVHAYEEWGADCVKRFNGMFAFAIWDANERLLLLARDHLGIKPLYYVTVQNQLVFASEIKALRQHPRFVAEVNLESLAEFFTFRYVPSPKTLFSKVMKLPPGHIMKVSSTGIKIERYWMSVPSPEKNRSEAEYIERYQYLLEDAVRLQMRSDVPVGLFLSSGVDSGALLAVMSKYAGRSVEAFTIGFEGGEKTSEVEDARAMARQFGAKHFVATLTPGDYMDYYGRYMGDLEEPVGNETAAAFYFVARLARQRVKVVLTGQGADEPWAGYDRYKGAKLSALYSRLPHAVTNTVAFLVRQMPGRMERLKRGVSSLGERDMLTRLAKVYSFFSTDMKAHLFQGALKSNLTADMYGTRQALGRLQSDVSHLDPLTQMLYIDTRANLPDDLLMVSDKTSMANSLESRVPFLDYRLVEFVESLPSHLKLNGFTGKYLHKKALTKWLPEEVVHRKKKGFANPVEDWFRKRMRPFVEECLLGADSSMARYFDQHYIAQILKKGSRRHGAISASHLSARITGALASRVHAELAVNFFAILFVTILGLFILSAPRRLAALPLIMGANYMTLGPTVEIGPFSFTVIRILIIVGIFRVVTRGERMADGWNTLDRIMVWWAVAAVSSFWFHQDLAASLVFRLGLAYNALGLYFLLRTFIQDTEDLRRTAQMVLLALVPVALEMIVEAATTRNLFSFLGGVPDHCEIRGGKVRAQGSYAHSILAGTVGAVCLPLAIALWTQNRKVALMGMAATGLMVLCSRSSGPIMAAFFSLLGIGLWRFRQYMRFIRWSIVGGVAALALVMNAPIYFLIYRFDITGSSTGWHRAILIESAIRDFGDWWLGGTDFTRDWTPNPGYSSDETDITNHYIRMAIWGGLPMLLLFVAALVSALTRVGRALHSRALLGTSDQFMIWALGAILFSHAASMMSVSYFDQSVFYLYFVLAAIGSLNVAPSFHATDEAVSNGSVFSWEQSPSSS